MDNNWVEGNLERLNRGFTAVLGQRSDGRALTHRFGPRADERILWIDGQHKLLRCGVIEKLRSQANRYCTGADVVLVNPHQGADAAELAMHRTTVKLTRGAATADSPVVVFIAEAPVLMRSPETADALTALIAAVRNAPYAYVIIAGDGGKLPPLSALPDTKTLFPEYGLDAYAYFGPLDRADFKSHEGTAVLEYVSNWEQLGLGMLQPGEHATLFYNVPRSGSWTGRMIPDCW